MHEKPGSFEGSLLPSEPCLNADLSVSLVEPAVREKLPLIVEAVQPFFVEAGTQVSSFGKEQREQWGRGSPPSRQVVELYKAEPRAQAAKASPAHSVPLHGLRGLPQAKVASLWLLPGQTVTTASPWQVRSALLGFIRDLLSVSIPSCLAWEVVAHIFVEFRRASDRLVRTERDTRGSVPCPGCAESSLRGTRSITRAPQNLVCSTALCSARCSQAGAGTRGLAILLLHRAS